MTTDQEEHDSELQLFMQKNPDWADKVAPKEELRALLEETSRAGASETQSTKSGGSFAEEAAARHPGLTPEEAEKMIEALGF